MCKWLCCYEWLFVMGKKKMHRHWDGLEFKHAGYGSSIYFKKGFSPFRLESPPSSPSTTYAKASLGVNPSPFPFCSQP